MRLQIPLYRVDVNREVDVVEEILRIYGYNHISLPRQLRVSLKPARGLKKRKLRNQVAAFLAAKGFLEVVNNSLTNAAYYSEKEQLVEIHNPLSQELSVMRKHMLFGGLENLAYNLNRRRRNLRFFEVGKTYRLRSGQYEETPMLALWWTGSLQQESWKKSDAEVDFFEMKALLAECFLAMGVSQWKEKEATAKALDTAQQLLLGKNYCGMYGQVNKAILSKFEIKETVYYAELEWHKLLHAVLSHQIKYQPVSKFPSVRRDLALLLDRSHPFKEIRRLARQVDNKLLKEVNLFDVYEGDKVGENKKSYGVSFTFQDHRKTLTDEQVDRIMEKLINTYKEELQAELR